MDSRHESFKEGLLNQLIVIINDYLRNNTDTIISNALTQNQIKNICSKIYTYLGVDVDVDGIISKHNLLSIDVVFFPKISDPEASKILKENEFLNLINEIQSIISPLPNDHLLSKEIINVLQENQLTIPNKRLTF